MTQKQIGVLIGVAALGLAWYYGRKTSAQLAAIATTAQSPSPVVNPPPVTVQSPGPGTDENGLTPGQPGYDWTTAGIG